MTIDEPGFLAGVPAPRVLGRFRSTWTLADQGVSSAQSLAIGLAITHAVGLAGVGAFALTFAAYQVVMVINRPLNGDPLTVGFSTASKIEQRRATRAAAGGACLLGLAGMLVVGGLALIIGGTVGSVLLAFAVCIPAFLVQDVWRCGFFMLGRPARSFANDAIVLAAMAPAFWVSLKVAPHNGAGLVLGWGAATLVGALVGAFQFAVLPKLGAGVAWWRSTLHFGGQVLGENILANFAYTVGIATIAIIAGESDLGRLRTAQVASGLATPIILAVALIVMADGSRHLADDPSRFPRLVTIGGSASVIMGLATAAFWYFLPVHLGRVLIGSNWSSSRHLVLGASAYVAAVGATTTLSAGLRAMRSPRVALRIRYLIAPMTICGAVLGAMWGGATGAIDGIAGAEGLGAIVMVTRFVQIWKGGLWQTQAPVYKTTPAT